MPSLIQLCSFHDELVIQTCHSFVMDSDCLNKQLRQQLALQIPTESCQCSQAILFIMMCLLTCVGYIAVHASAAKGSRPTQAAEACFNTERCCLLSSRMLTKHDIHASSSLKQCSGGSSGHQMLETRQHDQHKSYMFYVAVPILIHG